MTAFDFGSEVIVPLSVALIGTVIAGITAAIKTWFENRDARRRAERELDFATRRTAFVAQWVETSGKLGDDAAAIERARAELADAYADAQAAFKRVERHASVFVQFRHLLMLVPRLNAASYVVSGLFLLGSSFVWLLFLIRPPGEDSFSWPAAIFSAMLTTILIRGAAGLLVRVLERVALNDARAITRVAVDANVATITARAPHGLTEGQTVVVDASNDVFDGTFTVKSIDETTLSYALASADLTETAATGWVSRSTVKEQLNSLLMLDARNSVRKKIVSGLFLTGLLVVGVSYVPIANAELDSSDRYPRCYVDDYTGGYFGNPELSVDPLRLITDELGDEPYPPSETVRMWQDLLDPSVLPLWAPEATELEIKRVKNSFLANDAAPALVLETNFGTYRIDPIRGPFYSTEATALYRRSSDRRMDVVGEDCEADTIDVVFLGVQSIEDLTTLKAALDKKPNRFASLLFAYNGFDPDPLVTYVVDATQELGLTARYQELVDPEGQAPRTHEINAFFGADGRFIPVCPARSDRSLRNLDPCVSIDDVYYDSGVREAVGAIAGFLTKIIAAVIALRLLFELIDRGIDRAAGRRRRSRDAVAGDAVATGQT